MRYLITVGVAISVMSLTACDADSSLPAFAAASEEEISCEPSNNRDLTQPGLSWVQLGESIHGTPPEIVTFDNLGQAIGINVELSNDGKKVVSSVGYDITRSFTLSSEGLQQTGDDIQIHQMRNTEQFALSGDGNTLLQKTYDPHDFTNYRQGSVTALTRSADSDWQVNDHSFGDESSQEYRENRLSIAVNASGSLISVSSEQSDSTAVIKTYSMSKAGTWDQQDLIAGTEDGGVGYMVALSHDGLTMLSHSADGINIYRQVDNNWVQHETIAKFVNDHDPYENQWPVITNMALSGNGEVVAVAYASTSFRSIKDFSVRLFRVDGSSVRTFGQVLHGKFRHDSFGHGLDLNCNGSIVVIGADTKWTGDPGNPAYVSTFGNVDDTWHQIGEDITFDNIGLGDLALSADGKTVVIGQVNTHAERAHAENFYGELRAYKLTGNSVN